MFGPLCTVMKRNSASNRAKFRLEILLRRPPARDENLKAKLHPAMSAFGPSIRILPSRCTSSLQRGALCSLGSAFRAPHFRLASNYFEVQGNVSSRPFISNVPIHMLSNVALGTLSANIVICLFIISMKLSVPRASFPGGRRALFSQPRWPSLSLAQPIPSPRPLI